MSFQENYAGMSDGELLMVAASRRELVPEAASALDSEMGRRGLSYEQAHAKKREVARLQIKEARRHSPSLKGTKYFVASIKGWWLVLLVLGAPMLAIPVMALHLAPREWDFPIFTVCLGAIIAVCAVQPWLRKTASFWISLVASCLVQLPVGYWISVRLAPSSRSELKGAGFLTILPGYAVGAALFLLLEKLKPKDDTSLKSA